MKGREPKNKNMKGTLPKLGMFLIQAPTVQTFLQTSPVRGL